jgi:hypothetical protein
MNFALLREWLNLPPGPWPPGDRELLGLPAAGPIDATTVELKALERMDELRPRQLVQPDLVTEGMNRLAQAMIALTAHAPAAPAPAKKSKKIKEITPVETRRPDDDVRLDFDGSAKRNASSPTVTTPAVLDAEVIGFAEPNRQVIPESVAVLGDEPNVPAIIEPIELPDPPPGTIAAPAPRREGYRDLAAYRRVHDAWDRFRPLLGDPSERLMTPAKVAAYLESISALRFALRNHGDRAFARPDAAGQIVLTVVCHPVPLALLRDLVPSQRQALARDWARAGAEVESRLRQLRRAMNVTRPRRSLRRTIRFLTATLGRYPEWLFVLLVVFALLVGFRRQ